MYVYQITNQINNKVYIGITNNYKKRWENHKCNNDPSMVIAKAIKKYGKDNFIFEVLYSNLTVEKAEELEIKLIQEKNSLVPNGYNVSKGGLYFTNLKPLCGAKNGKALLTEEEAQYIKNHRNIPMYVLYEEFSQKISYESFKKCYKHQTYTDLIPAVEEYPYNFEFSNQFNSNSKLEYDDVVDLRERYKKGEYWKDVYQLYKDKYTNEMSFWNIYNGKTYSLIMPEVFNNENKKRHSSMKTSGTRNPKAKLTEEDVKTIRYLHSMGVSNKELYEKYSQVSATSIRDIINYKTWKNIS